ncbi:hypothetical protein ACMFMG_005079 [Clarireedia jacksonii]
MIYISHFPNSRSKVKETKILSNNFISTTPTYLSTIPQHQTSPSPPTIPQKMSLPLLLQLVHLPELPPPDEPPRPDEDPIFPFIRQHVPFVHLLPRFPFYFHPMLIIAAYSRLMATAVAEALEPLCAAMERLDEVSCPRLLWVVTLGLLLCLSGLLVGCYVLFGLRYVLLDFLAYGEGEEEEGDVDIEGVVEMEAEVVEEVEIVVEWAFWADDWMAVA